MNTESGGKPAISEVTGQQEFARLIGHFMATGKASMKERKKLGAGKAWSIRMIEDRAQLSDKTADNWIKGRNKPTWEKLILVLHLFFEDDIISGDVYDDEYEYIRDIYSYWWSPIPFHILKRDIREEEHPLSGRYLLLRHTFDAPDNFALFDVSFVFSQKARRLEFRQTELKDQDSTAFVTQPELSPHIEIVDTRQDGFNSLTICSVPDEDGYIYGAIFTMAQFSRNAHLPAIAPVVLFPFDETAKLGIVKPDDDRYDKYAELIARSRDPIVFKLHNLASF